MIDAFALFILIENIIAYYIYILIKLIYSLVKEISTIIYFKIFSKYKKYP